MNGLSRLIPDPLLVLDAQGRVLDANRQARALLGEACAAGSRPFTHDDGFRSLLEAASGTAEPVLGAVKLAGHEAKQQRFRVRAVVVERLEGELRFGVQVLDTRDDHFSLLSKRMRELNREVAEHEATHSRLRLQAQEFHALADNIPTLCWMAYADGYIYWYNRRWYEYTGAEADSQEGWGWESVHHPDHLPLVLERWKASLATGQPFEMTFPLKGKDGAYRAFLTRVVPIRDEAGEITRWFGTNTDVSEQARQQEHLELLINELNHRVKNTLATVQALATRSLRDAAGVKEGLEAFEGRLMALSAAHNVLTATKWEGAEFRELVVRALQPFADCDGGRVVLVGPELWLSQDHALSLALVFHELATNATKYGALRSDVGSLTVQWTVDGAVAPKRLELEWLERNGPRVEPPSRRGFGSRLIDRTVRGDLAGSVDTRFGPEGLTCKLSFPLIFERPRPLVERLRPVLKPEATSARASQDAVAAPNLPAVR